MKILSVFFLGLAISAFSQTAEQDSSSFEAAMKWLERKLTYNYYDPTNQQWWVNVIQARDNGAYTIKNIAAKHPNHVTEKVYHQRTFFLWDLNPKKVVVSEIPTDLGRFVKGKLIRMEGFKGEKKISTKKDGRVGSRVSYIHISIPIFLEDSLQEYAPKVAAKLSDALYLNARLFNANDTEDNLNSTFKTFRGNYVSEDSTSYLDFEVIGERLIRFTVSSENHKQFGTIGYDEKKEVVFYFLSTAESYLLREFKFDLQSRNLILRDESEDLIYVIGRNTLEFIIEGKKTKFFRY